MSTADFWRTPPWAGGKTKYQLGLRPLPADTPIVTPADQKERSRKRALFHAAYDKVVATTQHGRTVQDELLKQPWLPGPSVYPDTIANVAARIAEDLCLLDLDDEQRLIAGCVCAPSYWSLSEKLGQPLHGVHAPATGLNDVLGARIHRFIQGLPVEQSFRRQNWFLHGDANLYHPVPELALNLPCENWVMRSEVQTLYKLSPRYVLFVIRIICLPLSQITDYPSARRDLQRSLAAFGEDEVTHFGGENKHRRLMKWLSS